MGIITRKYPSDLAASVTRGLERNGYAVLERPARSGRTVAQRNEGRVATMPQADRAYRDARLCEWTEADRRLWNLLVILEAKP